MTDSTDALPLARLAIALSKAQGEFKPIIKDKVAKVRSEKGNYDYRYADLSSVRDSVTPALAKHELAVVQTFRPNGGTHQYVDTMLVHASGEFIKSSYQIPATGKQQEIGSAITYARRYSLCAILGVVAEDDDDGNSADQKQVKIEQTVSTQAAGKLDTIAQQSGDGYQMMDPLTGELDKFKLGTDWMIRAEEMLHQHQEPASWWAANEQAFYRIQQNATEAKHKKAIDLCSRLAKLAHQKTKPMEIIP